ncbi:MAG: VWA domain-containing protein [Candidatus Baltobacteraceae bacterium]
MLIAAYLYLLRRRSGQTLRFSNLAFLVAAAQPPRWAPGALAAAWIAAIVLIGFAALGPRAPAWLPVPDGSVILCVDTSGSMSATDVQPSRAAAAQAAMRAFIAAAPQGIAVGIVAFAGGAQVVMPPSRDRERVIASLAAVPSPNGGTAIGDALALAQRSLSKRGRRVIVLITDGVNNLGADPLQAARQLGRADIRLYTVGIGTNSGALVPGTLQEAGLDEEALREYAQAAGGAYRRAEDAGQLRQALARLGRTTTFEKRLADLSLPAALAGALLLAAVFLCGIWTKLI